MMTLEQTRNVAIGYLERHPEVLAAKLQKGADVAAVVKASRAHANWIKIRRGRFGSTNPTVRLHELELRMPEHLKGHCAPLYVFLSEKSNSIERIRTM